MSRNPFGKGALEKVENHFSDGLYYWNELYDYYDFKIMGLLFVSYFEGGDCVINEENIQENILPILSKNYKRNGLLNKHDC
jgi:hypothetical protein